jgi:hypothetical protein
MSYGINHQVCIEVSPKEIYNYLSETEMHAQLWRTTDSKVVSFCMK